MLYPKKIDAKKGKKIIKLMLIISAILALVLILINKLTRPDIHWAALSIAGIIYIWITVWYSLNKNTNIAGHILLQTIAVSILMIYIDYIFGFNKWSLSRGIPIVIITANIAMAILTIISHKKYIRYVIFQLLLSGISTTPLILISEHIVENKILSIVSIGVSIVNFILTILLCKNDIKEELKRKFHL